MRPCTACCSHDENRDQVVSAHVVTMLPIAWPLRQASPTSEADKGLAGRRCDEVVIRLPCERYLPQPELDGAHVAQCDSAGRAFSSHRVDALAIS